MEAGEGVTDFWSFCFINGVSILLLDPLETSFKIWQSVKMIIVAGSDEDQVSHLKIGVPRARQSNIKYKRMWTWRIWILLPFNAWPKVWKLPCDDVNEHHEIISVEVLDASLGGEHVQNQFVDRVDSIPGTYDLSGVIFPIEKQQQLLREYLGIAGTWQTLEDNVIRGALELKIVGSKETHERVSQVILHILVGRALNVVQEECDQPITKLSLLVVDRDSLAQAEENREEDTAVLEVLHVSCIVKHVLGQLQRQHRDQHQGDNVGVQGAHEGVGLYQHLPDAPAGLHLEILHQILDIEILVSGQNMQTNVSIGIL